MEYFASCSTGSVPPSIWPAYKENPGLLVALDTLRHQVDALEGQIKDLRIVLGPISREHPIDGGVAVGIPAGSCEIVTDVYALAQRVCEAAVSVMYAKSCLDL